MSYPYPYNTQGQYTQCTPYEAVVFPDPMGLRPSHPNPTLNRYLQPIYSNTNSSVTPENPNYPYPVVKNSTSYPPGGYDGSQHDIISQSYRARATGGNRPQPANYTVLPQPIIQEHLTYNIKGLEISTTHPYIVFNRGNGKPQYTISDLLGRNHQPNLVGGDDKVLAAGDRQIKIKIMWPGYSRFPLEKRIKTNNGQITRAILLVMLAQALCECLTFISEEGVAVERGYEQWAIKTLRVGSTGFIAEDCQITGLVHRSGCTWQPEIYVPTG